MAPLPGSDADVPPIASAEAVAAAIADGRPVVLADMRLDPADGPPLARCEGAVVVDLDTVCADPPAPILGRHPLPTAERFATELGALGMSPGHHVVVYDDLAGLKAGRLVWMLRTLGRPASLLDGGAAAAAAAALATTTPAPATVPAQPWPADAIVDADRVVATIEAGGTVLDARSGERHRGEIEPLDAVAGHIPGARNVPFTTTMDAGGRLLTDAELADLLDGFDDTTVVSCGSGVSACQLALAIEQINGGRPRLYVGSWSGWSTEPGRPIATGPEATP